MDLLKVIWDNNWKLTDFWYYESNCQIHFFGKDGYTITHDKELTSAGEWINSIPSIFALFILSLYYPIILILRVILYTSIEFLKNLVKLFTTRWENY